MDGYIGMAICGKIMIGMHGMTSGKIRSTREELKHLNSEKARINWLLEFETDNSLQVAFSPIWLNDITNENRMKLVPITIALIMYTSIAISQVKIVDPEHVGFSPDRLDKINTFFDEKINKSELAGAITLIARNHQIGFYQTYGFMDIDEQVAMDKNAIVRIA